MSNKKQTLVEWLEEQQAQLFNQVKNGEIQIDEYEYYSNLIIKQAKEMENKLAHDYAEFAIRCDRMGMKILNFEDWIKL